MFTPEQLMRKLDERFILGEIDQAQYQQLRDRLLAAGPATAPAEASASTSHEPVAGENPAHAGGMTISDSVIKGNVTSGSASVGNINIHVGRGAASADSAE